MQIPDLAQIDFTDPSQQAAQLKLFDALKNDPAVLFEACSRLMADDMKAKHHQCFFLLLIVEHNLKQDLPPDTHQIIKEALSKLAHHGAGQPPFLANKTAQILSLAFTQLYPNAWPDFFDKLILTGPEIFLRTLSQIDGEVVNRQINHSKCALDRNTRLKDEMRAKDVTQLVAAWSNILEAVEKTTLTTEIGELCFEVIGQYVEWIDINLIVNESFMAQLFTLLSRSDLTDSVCDCMCEIVQKGMPPKEKCILVEQLYTALVQAGLFTVQAEEHLESIAQLVATLGSELVIQKEKLCAKACSDEEKQLGNEAMIAVSPKLELAIQLLRNDDNDVAKETIKFIQAYLDCLRKAGEQPDTDVLKKIIEATVLKMRYPNEYNFESSGLDEAELDEFMEDMKQLFESVCLIQPYVALECVNTRVQALSASLSPYDAECTVRLLYQLGECLPTEMGTISFKADPKSPLQNLFGSFVSKQVPTHQAVVRLSLETLVRYDKYFMFEKGQLGPVLHFMIGQGGIMHPHASVRSRAAYLFSRFVREMTPALGDFATSLLQALESCALEGGQEFLSESDRGFVFEAIGYLVNVSPISAEEKAQLYARMVGPIVEAFQRDCQSLLAKKTEEEQEACCLVTSYYVGWCGRTTKAWRGPEQVAAAQAGPILAECVKVFLSALEIPHNIAGRSIILQSIRTFLHRMLICLSTDILVLLPNALSSLLSGACYKDLHELFPLINQIAMKFKEAAQGVMVETLPQLYQATFALMSGGHDPEEEKLITRDFFSFLHNLCKSNLAEVLMSSQSQAQLPEIIEKLKNGALGKDPVASKLCFMIFSRLAKEWANKYAEFGQVVQNTIIPSCFIGPSSPHFDLKDAQCQMAIVESANCMKDLFEISGSRLIDYLQNDYMTGQLNCSKDLTEEYVQALMTKDIKGMWF